jgi:hypothetical protein
MTALAGAPLLLLQRAPQNRQNSEIFFAGEFFLERDGAPFRTAASPPTTANSTPPSARARNAARKSMPGI